MLMGIVKFEHGSMIQGWNPGNMSPKVREQIAACLEDVALHMRQDEFEEAGEYVYRPYKPAKKAKTAKKKK